MKARMNTFAETATGKEAMSSLSLRTPCCRVHVACMCTAAGRHTAASASARPCPSHVALAFSGTAHRDEGALSQALYTHCRRSQTPANPSGQLSMPTITALLEWQACILGGPWPPRSAHAALPSSLPIP